MNEKGCRIPKNNSQNWINIYVLSFKAMPIMESYCFFIYMMLRNQTKNLFDEIFNLSSHKKPLKVHNNTSNMNQFYKGLSKGLI
jgi:hypothetical protein